MVIAWLTCYPINDSGGSWITNVSKRWSPIGAGWILVSDSTSFLFSQVVFQVPSADCALSLRQEVPGKDGSAAGKAGDRALAGRFHHTGSLAGSLGLVERGGDILCHVAG